MSKTISLPVILQEVTDSSEPHPAIRPVKDAIRFPEQCVYCGAPKPKEFISIVSTRTNLPRLGGGPGVFGGKYKGSAPYCDTHFKQSKTFKDWLNRSFLIAFLVIGIPIGLIGGIGTYQLFVTINDDNPTGAFFWSLIIGIAVAVIVAVLASLVGKTVIGLFVPAMKDYSSALGISVVIAEPKEKADLKTHTLDFTFTNEEYATMFGEINQLSSEDMATIPAQLEAAEQARAAEADKRAVEARDVKTEA